MYSGVPFVKMHLLHWISIFFTQSLTFGFSENSRGKVILDISRIITYAMQTDDNGTIGWNALDRIATEGNSVEGPTLMCYETDLDENVIANLENVTSILTKMQLNYTNFQPKIVVVLRDVHWKLETYTPHKSRNYADMLYFIANHTTLFAGVSFEVTEISHILSILRSNSESQNLVHLIKNVRLEIEKHRLDGFSRNQNMIGYVVEWNNRFTERFSLENIEYSDFLLVNVRLQLHDKIFVESYGIFSDNMNQVTTWAAKYTQKPILYRLQLNVGLSNQIIAIRYEQLLTSYVNHWIPTTGYGTWVILNYLYGNEFSINDDSLEWMEIGLIPYLPNLQLLNVGTWSTISARIFLEDVESSGFERVIVNGKTWKELTKTVGSYNFSCNQTSRINLIYVIDDIKREEIKLCKIPEATMFSFYMNRWIDVLNHFESLKNDLVSSNDMSHNLCFSWSRRLSDLRDAGRCSSTCIANYIETSGFTCDSLTNLTDNFIWAVRFDVSQNDVGRFVEETMKLMDAFVLARQNFMLLENNFNKRIILKISGEYTATSGTTGPKPSLYCSVLVGSVTRFYEAVLTWARIHDFPVIFELAVKGNIGNYVNPFSWEQLSITGNGPMRRVMESGPLFVSRRYDQSKILGSWTKGMYSCIPKATLMFGVQNLDFEHERVGVAVNLDLLNGNPSLKTDVVQTLLLFALGRFTVVEITLLSVQMELLSKTISNHTFQQNLNLNEIRSKKIYLSIQNYSANFASNLNSIASALESTGPLLFIQSSNPIDTILPTIPVGIIHPNCINLVENIVLHLETLDNNLKMANHLICETEPIVANDLNIQVVEDYLNSHLYMKKILEHFYPNLREIHFRLQPTSIGTTTEEQTKNLFLFLADVNTFAKIYKIHYFLLPAYVLGVETVGKQSYWTISNYTDLANVSVYQDNLAMMKNQETWRPNFTIPHTYLPNASILENSGPSIIENVNTKSAKSLGLMEEVGIGLGVIVTVILVPVVLVVTFRRTRTYHRKETIDNKNWSDFFSGSTASNHKAHVDVALKCPYDKSYEILRENMEMENAKLLGTGQFACVLEVKIKYQDEYIPMALKMPKADVPKDGDIEGLLSEIKILMYLGEHANIVGMKGAYTAELQNGIVYLATELCKLGSLEGYLRKLATSTDKNDDYVNGLMKSIMSTEGNNIYQDLVRWSLEIGCGMEYLGIKHIVHADLATRNVLLTSDRTAKITDFGLSRKLYNYQNYVKTKQEPLPWRWMAIESLKRMEFSAESDVWSYGVTLWEIFSMGNTPYPGLGWTLEFVDLLDDGLRLKSPAFASEEMFSVMSDCWHSSPQDRPTFPLLLDRIKIILQT